MTVIQASERKALIRVLVPDVFVLAQPTSAQLEYFFSSDYM